MSEGHDRRSIDNDLGYREHRPRASKDRRRWCRGKDGVEHQVVVAVPANTPGWAMNRTKGDSPCGFSMFWPDEWYCYHARMCTECGKVLDASLRPAQCPTYQAAHDQSAS